jgi:hypothetical protein
VIIVAVHADAPLKLGNRLPDDLKPIVKLDAVNAKLGYVATKLK